MIPAAAIFVLAGCGGTVVSGRKAENLVKHSLDQNYKSVTCPSGAPAKKGGTVVCKVVFANGDTAMVTLHETDNKGDVSASSNDLKVQTIGGASARQVVLSWAAGRHIVLASVTCPASSPATVGRSIACKAADRTGSNATITLLVVNTKGGMRVIHVHG